MEKGILEDEIREQGGSPKKGSRLEWIREKRRLETEILIIEEDGKQRKADKPDSNDGGPEKLRIAGITKILPGYEKQKKIWMCIKRQ